MMAQPMQLGHSNSRRPSPRSLAHRPPVTDAPDGARRDEMAVQREQIGRKEEDEEEDDDDEAAPPPSVVAHEPPRAVT